MKNQAYRMALLYDFYGDMLTDRQKEFYDLYYNEDLSLAEIAENYGITRQGVRDVIVRAEAILTELEDKTGLIKRFHTMQTQLEQVRQNAQRVAELAAGYDNEELERLAGQIVEQTETLLQEQFGQMETAVDAIAKRNEAHWQDDELESLCGQLKGVLAQLKQE